MSLYQLPDPIEVEAAGERGFAVLVESDANDYYWTVVFPSGVLVTYPQKKIRYVRSFAMGGVSDAEMKAIIGCTSLKTTKS